MILQFDGCVVEVFGGSSGDVHRHHVAQMKEPEVRAPNRKGRSLVSVAGSTFGVDADELVQLKPLLDEISEAVRIAKDQPFR